MHTSLVLYIVGLSFANLVFSERIYTEKQLHESQAKQAIVFSKKLPVCFNPQRMLPFSPDMINSLSCNC